MNNFYFIHSATATNFAADDYEQILLESVISQELYHLSIIEAIQKGYIVPISAIFFEIQNSNLSTTGKYQENYKRFVDKNVLRNKKIVETIQTLTERNIQTLALVKHVDHGKLLNELIQDSTFIKGESEKSKKNKNRNMIKSFNSLELNPLIGTSVIGEGVDTKSCGAVFNCKAGKSKKEVLQNVGRVVRNFPGKNVGFYFDFYDKKQKHLAAQARCRMRIIEDAYGIEVKVIKI